MWRKREAAVVILIIIHFAVIYLSVAIIFGPFTILNVSIPCIPILSYPAYYTN
jgi:hypothetical protein